MQASDLKTAESWVFDLDNTLYPVSANLFDQIDKRMCAYIANFLQLDQSEAYKVQKQYFREYGTSLKGMMDNHQMDHNFQDIFDIVDADFVPKPEPLVYEYFVKRHKIIPKNSVMVEDIARNLRPAADMGMKTVWVLTDRPWAHAEAESTNPDFTIDNLSLWLTEVAEL